MFITRGTTSQRLGSISFSFFFLHVAISDSIQWLPFLEFVPGPMSKGLMSLLFSQHFFHVLTFVASSRDDSFYVRSLPKKCQSNFRHQFFLQLHPKAMIIIMHNLNNLSRNSWLLMELFAMMNIKSFYSIERYLEGQLAGNRNSPKSMTYRFSSALTCITYFQFISM